MSLAQDILNNTINLSPPVRQKPEPVRRKRHMSHPLLPNKKSGYPCVFYDRRNKKFRAQIRIEGKHVSLGSFTKPKRAYLAVMLYLLWDARGYENIPNSQRRKGGYIEYTDA